MKQVLFVLMAMALAFCGAKSTSEPSSGEPTLAPAASDAASPQTTVATTTNAAGTVSQQLTISADQRSVKTGETMCMDVRVAGFEKLLSMQYTITWNGKALKFKELKNLNLPYLGKDNFGDHRVEEGILTVAWIDDSLKGQSLPDGSVIYQVCLEAIGKPGGTSYFKFTDVPTAIEVVNLREKIIPLKRQNGSIEIVQ
jgi:hypothetical protein